MKLGSSIQDRADFRFRTSPPSRSGCFEISKLCVFSKCWHYLRSFFNCNEELSFRISCKKPASEHSFDNFWSSGSSANFHSYSCNKVSLCQWCWQKDTQISPSVWFLESVSNSWRKFSTAPWILCWLTKITVRRTNSTFSSLPLKWMDFFPFPLFFFLISSSQNTGGPKNRMSAFSKVEHHDFSRWVPLTIKFADMPDVFFLNLLGHLQSQSPEKILVSIVVLHSPLNNIAGIHKCYECKRSNALNVGDKLLSTWGLIEQVYSETTNIRSTNTCQMQALLDLLRADSRQLSHWSIFFFSGTFRIPRLKALLLLNTGWPDSLKRRTISVATESHFPSSV